MEMFMIYKISPFPLFAKEGKRKAELFQRGGGKGRNDSLNYAKRQH
jgi:hypothetical protein